MTDTNPPAMFLTGSRVYGDPRPDSDLDLVIYVPDEAVLEALRPEAMELAEGSPEYGPFSFSARFGSLNLICVTSQRMMMAWWIGTLRCIAEAVRLGRPLLRPEAVEIIMAAREEFVWSQLAAEGERDPLEMSNHELAS